MFTSPACWCRITVSGQRIMIMGELRELEKEYKRVNKIRDGSDNNNGLGYQQVKVKVSDIDSVSQVDQAINGVLKPTLWIRCASRCRSRCSSNSFWGSLAAISLLVAAIGITNTMIMSIYERTREIGVMKVLGCRVGNIRAVFLMEAGLIGFGGGLAGVSLLISKLLNYLSMNGGMGADGGRLSGMGNGFGFAAFHHSGLADCRGDCVCHRDRALFILLTVPKFSALEAIKINDINKGPVGSISMQHYKRDKTS